MKAFSLEKQKCFVPYTNKAILQTKRNIYVYIHIQHSYNLIRFVKIFMFKKVKDNQNKQKLDSVDDPIKPSFFFQASQFKLCNVPFNVNLLLFIWTETFRIVFFLFQKRILSGIDLFMCFHFHMRAFCLVPMEFFLE